jgi:hypothetical protein
MPLSARWGQNTPYPELVVAAALTLIPLNENIQIHASGAERIHVEDTPVSSTNSRNRCSLDLNAHHSSNLSPTSKAPLTEAAVSPAPFNTICRLISRYICSYECILLTVFLRKMRCFASA